MNLGFTSKGSKNSQSEGHDFFRPKLKHYQCNQCDYSNNRLFNFTRHMRRHTGEMFECELCGVRYNCKYMMTKHNRNVHPQLAIDVDASVNDSL